MFTPNPETDTRIITPHTKQKRRPSLLISRPLGIFLIICFFLPWVIVGCDADDAETGFQLASGVVFDNSSFWDVGCWIWLTLAIVPIAGIATILTSFIWKRQASRVFWVSSISGLTVMGLHLSFWLPIWHPREIPPPSPYISPLFWLGMAILLIGGLVTVWGLFIWKRQHHMNGIVWVSAGWSFALIGLLLSLTPLSNASSTQLWMLWWLGLAVIPFTGIANIWCLMVWQGSVKRIFWISNAGSFVVVGYTALRMALLFSDDCGAKNCLADFQYGFWLTVATLFAIGGLAFVALREETQSRKQKRDTTAIE